MLSYGQKLVMKLSGGVLSTFDPSSFRHYRWACKFSLKVMVSAVLRLRHALVFTVRNRTVAKLLSIGLVVSSVGRCPPQSSDSPRVHGAVPRETPPNLR